MSLYDPGHSRSSSLCLRSSRLLRDTLLKDRSLRDDPNRSTASLPLPATMALVSPPSTPIRTPLSPASMSDYSPRIQYHQSPSKPTTSSDRQRATPPSLPRRPHTARPTPTHTRDHSCSPLSSSDHPQHPHLITPHEQVLRTRLERVLFSAGVAEDTSKRRDSDRERGRGRSPTAGIAATSVTGSTRTIKRNRASTEPHILPSPPPSSSHFLRLAASSPSSKHPSVSRSGSLVRHKKRPSTGRSIASGSASGSASCSASGSGNRSATGTTPPLVLDDEDHDDRREPRLLLLTPPASPSPPNLGYFQVDEWSYQSQCYRGTVEDDDDDVESCSSSCSSYREGSSKSSSAVHSPVAHPSRHPLQLRTPTSPHSKMPPHLPQSMRRPFNARRASVQCRAMEGYVSFANVEGLGVPPDEPPSPHPHSQEKGAKGVLTALGWGGGVVRKILGGGAEKPEDAPGGVVY